MRYSCLILDHDDTVMDSTRHIHYPAFLDALKVLRPEVRLSLEDYFRVNYAPGFLPYCEEVLGLTPEEMQREYAIWQSWVARKIPAVYPGMARIIRRQVAEGGRIAVVSHSVDANIRRDYAENGLPQPALVFGWEQPRARRKPNPWPVQEVLRVLRVAPEDALMLDDLRPGRDMAMAAGVDFAAALWSHEIPEIQREMREASPHAFTTPDALYDWLFE